MRAHLSLLLALAPGIAAAEPLVLRDGERLLTTTDRDTWLDRARCVCGVPLSVTLDLSGATATSASRAALVVGKSCLTSESRIATTCRTIWSDKIGSDAIRTVDAPADTLAGSCTIDDTQLTLSLFVDAEDDDQWVSFASLTLGADVIGPKAPKKSTMVPGEGLVEVAITSGDTSEEGVYYQVLCATDAGDPVHETPPAAAQFVSPWDLCAAPDADPLVSEAFVCAEARAGTESVTVTGLTNGHTYTISVVAVDAQGNASERTVLGSATPAEEEDFWERYLRSGGQADGSGCQAVGGADAWTIAAVALWAAARRVRA